VPTGHQLLYASEFSAPPLGSRPPVS